MQYSLKIGESMFSLVPPWLKISLIAITLTAVFSGGYYTKGKFDEAAQLKAMADVAKNLQAKDEAARQTVKDLQDKNETLNQSYIQLQEDLRNEKGKITTTPCHITDVGIGLWDSIGKGTVSEATTGTPKETIPSNPTGAQEDSGFTLEDLYENKRENDEICNGFRNQLNAIIDLEENKDGSYIQ